jgi:XTP/dITP diphosphohydrolase
MTRLLFATRNSHKTRELGQLLGGDFQIRDLCSMANAPEIVESGSTFQENAVIKALAISRAFPDELVLADDSGLEVDALDGAPGVLSARYAEANASDHANVEKILSELKTVRARSRKAMFVCAFVLARNGELVSNATGTIGGTITEEPRGDNGFGYDPIFVPAGFSQTFAELPSEVKNRISHRARAAQKLATFFKTAHPSW